ncbi:hypothetical protein AURDEDRAFT_173476 [Auricularia subglabra TFB-10046 SS5]|nr:hypothetical protein AURDEDRAFT_173476 [Auricularia subglabra TFB-10046 SS5]
MGPTDTDIPALPQLPQLRFLIGVHSMFSSDPLTVLHAGELNNEHLLLELVSLIDPPVTVPRGQQLSLVMGMSPGLVPVYNAPASLCQHHQRHRAIVHDGGGLH